MRRPDLSQHLAAGRVSKVARTMSSALPRLGTELHEAIAEAIPELRGDDAILELLRASTASNVENFLQVAQHDIAVEQVRPPAAAIEYARRLAQRAISANALLRAYRIGQYQLLDWVVAEVARQEPDRDVALAAAQIFQRTSFAYVDHVSELVVAEYESERERWLAQRNTVRTAMLTTVLSGRAYDLGTAESALGYRLRQHHLGAVVWTSEEEGVPSDLRLLESLASEIGETLESAGQPIFLPQDRNLGWCWVPLGVAPADDPVDLTAIARLTEKAGPGVRIALGRPGGGAHGFRTTHLQAQRAHAVASVGGASRVTTFDEPAVQLCSILGRDVEATRNLVADSLGDLAIDTENNAELRETVLAFLRAKSSYVAAAHALHLHRNTVKYRVDKAMAMRGRDLDDDRLNLELALTACQWLGQAVLARE